MNTTRLKPRHLSEKYAARFKHQSVAEAYRYRPPYSREVYDILVELITDKPKTVLDVGCGLGNIALGLADRVDRVDAIDFSEAMIEIAKRLPGGSHPSINWICGRLEDSNLNPPYALIVAGASLHWLDWYVVFPQFKKMLTKNGYIVDVRGDRPTNSTPWKSKEKELIRRYSTNKDYQPFDLIEHLISEGLFEKCGERTTSPFLFEQTIGDYIESLHSRESLCKESMGPGRLRDFGREMVDLLSNYSIEGKLRFEITTNIVWGYPN